MPLSIDYSKIADIYDSYVTSDFDIPFWIQEATKVRGKVLELTCGTGRISIPLLKAGVNLTCVDYCPEMLAVLKARIESEALTCTVVEMDISKLSLPLQYDLIFIPFNTLSEVIDRSEQVEALSRIRQHLAKDGEFICTLRNPKKCMLGMDGSEGVIGTFSVGIGSTLIVKRRMIFEESSREAHGFQLYEFRDPDGKIAASRSVEVCFVLPEREEFEELTKKTGFTIKTLYGDYDYTKFDGEKSPYMIWKLKANKL